MTDSRPGDPYARSEYRRLIAWNTRIAREAPFLTGLLDDAPDRSVLDIGCGTGEHTAFFARSGARAVGIDRSESMIAGARDHEARGEGRFLRGDAVDAAALLADEPRFGLIICLGNMLPHITDTSAIERLFGVVHELLMPGGRFLVQLLNYRKILDSKTRHLPINLREGDGSQEIVFLRLLQHVSDERILFFPTTLVLDPDADEPVRVEMSRRVELRPWTAPDLLPILRDLGFTVEQFGDMQGGTMDESSSSDLVLVATRAT